MGQPLWKNPIWHPQNEGLYKRSFRSFYLSKTSSNIFSYSIFTKKQSKRNLPILTQNCELTPLEKSNIWQPQNEIFIHSLFGLFSRLKHRQAFFLILFWQKTINKKLSNFHAKSWVNPFRKIQYGTPKIKVFINVLFDRFSRLKHRQSSFLTLFRQKTIKKKLSNCNFDKNSWVNPFGKIQYDTP